MKARLLLTYTLVSFTPLCFGMKKPYEKEINEGRFHEQEYKKELEKEQKSRFGKKRHRQKAEEHRQLAQINYGEAAQERATGLVCSANLLSNLEEKRSVLKQALDRYVEKGEYTPYTEITIMQLEELYTCRMDELKDVIQEPEQQEYKQLQAEFEALKTAKVELQQINNSQKNKNSQTSEKSQQEGHLNNVIASLNQAVRNGQFENSMHAFLKARRDQRTAQRQAAQQS